VSLRPLGNAGFILSCEDTTILIDPYVTRLPLTALLRRKFVAASREAIDRWVPHADAILVGHTHFDHALDAPAIAHRDQCTVYGSTSMAHLLCLHGLDHQAVVVAPHRAYVIGPFTVTFIPSAHAKIALGVAVPQDGELTCDQLNQLNPQAYRCGAVYGIHIVVHGTTIYHQGSADLCDNETPSRGVDVLLCALAGWRYTPSYLPRLLSRLHPAVIVPTHFDNFFRPLDAPTTIAFGADLARFADEATTLSPHTNVIIPG
jgi:L-ascorbate metabolism protein UlaG (beta-lactamase superfamily)